MDPKPKAELPNERGYTLLHKAFQVSLILKGLNAAAELVGGFLLVLIPYETLQKIIASLVGTALEWNLGKIWHELLGKLGLGIAPDLRVFFIWYLLSHGVIKAFVVTCLFKGWRWAYPLGIVVLLGFIVFQIIEMAAGRHTGMFIFLTIFDFFIIGLTANEWHHAKKLGLAKA